MAIRRPGYEETAARHAREHADDTRQRRWFWVRTALLCVFWALLGLVIAGYGFHVTDVEIGWIAVNTGQLVTLAGVLGTLGWALIQSEKRGWR